MNDSKQDIINLLATTEPNADRLAIVPDEREKMTKNLIARAQIAKGEDETEVGTVVSCGKGYTTEYGQWMENRSKNGDRVLMDRFAGIRLRLDRQGKFHAQHVDVTDDLLPVRIVRQDAILMTLPPSWPK